MTANPLPDLNQLALPALYAHLEGTGFMKRLIELARDEDLGPIGDVTAQAIEASGGSLRADLVLRQPGVVCGLAVGQLVCEVFSGSGGGGGGGRAEFENVALDGDVVEAGALVGRVQGDHAAVVTVERTLLNLVGRLSGVATRAAEFVRAVEGTGAQILDTRKTTPGLRMLEKYAVRCGGGHCHRLGLSDAVLIKDNHVAGLSLDGFAERVLRAAQRAAVMRGEGKIRFVQVEVDSLEQLDRVLGVEPGLIDIVLLDNFTIEQLETSVRMRLDTGSQVQYEASGGITLNTVCDVAKAGVDRVSVGGLTHGAVSLDVGLDVSG